MSNPLIDALTYAGEVLDKPGRAVRGALAGRPDEALAFVPFSDTLGLTDPSRRVSGRGLLEQTGLLAPKEEDEGFGMGDVAGIATEIGLDPINFLGGAWATKLLHGNQAAKANNLTRAARIAEGAMPEEIAAATKAVDATGKPLKTYHGTSALFDKYDMGRMSPQSLYGPGIYTTADENVARTYMDKLSPQLEGKKAELLTDAMKHRNEAMNLMHDLPIRKNYSIDPDIAGELRNAGVPMTLVESLASSGTSPDFGVTSPWFRKNIEAAKSFGVPDQTLAKLEASFVDSPHAGVRMNALRAAELRNLADSMESQAAALRGTPNVREQFLDVRKPFDLNEDMAPSDFWKVLDALGQGEPPHRQKQLYTGMPAEAAYDLLKDWGTPDKVKLNQALREAGFDAIRHTGGQVTGGKAHDVWIALNGPDQVYKPMLAPALQPTKRVSPLLAALAGENLAARSVPGAPRSALLDALEQGPQ